MSAVEPVAPHPERPVAAASAGMWRDHPWSAVGILVAVIALIALLVPVVALGRVADDFVLQVEDANLPWYASSDHVYRPLRNGLYHVVLPAVFGHQVEPYRLLALGAFCAVLVLLACFLRKEGSSWPAIAVTLAVVALFPRNTRVLFGLSWAQESAAAGGVLAALLAWRRFRVRGGRFAYALSMACFAVALGFKETSAVFPALALLTDIRAEGGVRELLGRRTFWAAFAGPAIVLVLFACFVLSQPEGRLLAPVADSNYQYSSIAGGGLALARAVANLLLPFAQPFGLRDLSAADLVLIALEVSALVAVAVATGTERAWLVALGWVLLSALPPSLFARSNNGDQYLFFPLVGVATALVASLDVLMRRQGRGRDAAVGLALVVYTLTSWQYLTVARAEWEASARIVAVVLETVQSGGRPSEGGALTFVNLPHSVGRAPALNNGLRGLLMVAGYPRETPVRLNHAMHEDADQDALVRRVTVCERGPAGSERVWVFQDGTLQERSGPCARAAVEEDSRRRPTAWRACD